MKWNAHQYFHPLIRNVVCVLTVGLYAVSLCSQELQWKVLGHLQQPRTDFGIATIGRGRVLVVGGVTDLQGIRPRFGLIGKVTALCEIIDVCSRSVAPAPLLNVPHAQAPVLQTADSNVVVISGLNSDSTTTPICEIFDRRQNMWRVLGSLRIGRHQHTASFINQDEIIVVGGRAGYNYAPPIAEAEIFNIRTGKSRAIPDFPLKNHVALYLQSSVFLSGYSLVFGGICGGHDSYKTSNIYYFDTLRQCWKLTVPFPIAVQHVFGNRLWDNRLIFVGGVKQEHLQEAMNLSPYIIVENPNGFSIIGTTIKSRADCTIEQWNNDVIIFMGGHDEKYAFLHQTEWFDLRTKSSFEGPLMNEARARFGSVSFPLFGDQGKQQKSCLIAIGGMNVEKKSLSSVEILETTNPQLIELPSTEIASRRRQQLLTSPAVIMALTAFILVLIAALLYLLYQVFIIRKQTKFSLIDGASEGQKI